MSDSSMIETEIESTSTGLPVHVTDNLYSPNDEVLYNNRRVIIPALLPAIVRCVCNVYKLVVVPIKELIFRPGFSLRLESKVKNTKSGGRLFERKYTGLRHFITGTGYEHGDLYVVIPVYVPEEVLEEYGDDLESVDLNDERVLILFSNQFSDGPRSQFLHSTSRWERLTPIGSEENPDAVIGVENTPMYRNHFRSCELPNGIVEEQVSVIEDGIEKDITVVYRMRPVLPPKPYYGDGYESDPDADPSFWVLDEAIRFSKSNPIFVNHVIAYIKACCPTFDDELARQNEILAAVIEDERETTANIETRQRMLEETDKNDEDALLALQNQIEELQEYLEKDEKMKRICHHQIDELTRNYEIAKRWTKQTKHVLLANSVKSIVRELYYLDENQRLYNAVSRYGHLIGSKEPIWEAIAVVITRPGEPVKSVEDTKLELSTKLAQNTCYYAEEIIQEYRLEGLTSFIIEAVVTLRDDFEFE